MVLEELPNEGREPSEEVAPPYKPSVKVYYGVPSAMDGLVNKNMILWGVSKRVKFVYNSEGSKTARICLVSDTFKNEDGANIRDGVLYIISSPTVGGHQGIHLLVIPNNDGHTNARGPLEYNAARDFCYNQLQSKVKGLKSGEWVAITIRKPDKKKSEAELAKMSQAERDQEEELYKGKFVVLPPAAKCGVRVFTPSSQVYSPLPEVYGFLLKGLSNFFGELVTDTRHPAYISTTEVTS